MILLCLENLIQILIFRLSLVINTKEIINNVESLNCDVGFVEGEYNRVR